MQILRLAVVPKLVDGGWRRKDVGSRQCSSQKGAEGGDTVALGICFDRLIREMRSEVTSGHCWCRPDAEVVQESVRHGPSQRRRVSRQPQM